MSAPLASDPVRVFCVEVRVFNKGEEKDRSFDPEKEDSFQKKSYEATGREETMKEDHFTSDKDGEGQEGW